MNEQSLLFHLNTTFFFEYLLFRNVAISVRLEYRNIGIAKRLINNFEQISRKSDCKYVDLFVRVSNTIAIKVYEKLGYTVNKILKGYYDDENKEDALELRKVISE
ncbi:hypothetical protein A3Q56_07347 [Intoshia linei]|uniref:N-alpha-acetyltransferase 20 n=1 Tax=Intoshia linei TaxID=1819745 RepID=A0A177ASW6_9BILA|nr:hypothetical protein A3Q56_07347 [Intoshia linei]